MSPLQQVRRLRAAARLLAGGGPSLLDRPGFSPLEVLAFHVARLRWANRALQQKLCETAEALAD